MKVVLIPKVEMVSDTESEDTLGASQGKLQEYKDMWAVAKEGNIPAGYVTASLLVFNRSDFDIDRRYYRERIIACIASQVAKSTRASFGMMNCGALSVPTTTRDAC